MPFCVCDAVLGDVAFLKYEAEGELVVVVLLLLLLSGGVCCVVVGGSLLIFNNSLFICCRRNLSLRRKMKTMKIK